MTMQPVETLPSVSTGCFEKERPCLSFQKPESKISLQAIIGVPNQKSPHRLSSLRLPTGKLRPLNH
jgi:hypothetical protein